MSGALLAIARGALQGMDDTKQLAYQDAIRQRQLQAQQLRELADLSRTPGFSVAPPAPAEPAPGSAPAQRSALDAAHAIWKSSVAGDTPGAPIPKAAAQTLAPKSSALTVARETLGNQPLDVTYDPSLSEGTQKAARLRANQYAHQQLAAVDDTVGTFDPSKDYEGELQKYRKRKQVADALVKTGEYTPEQATIYAQTGQDLAERAGKDAYRAAETTRAQAPKAPTPGTPAYYAIQRRVAEIRTAARAGSDTNAQREKWVRGRMIALIKSPGKNRFTGKPLPGLSRDEALGQANDEWDAVIAGGETGATPARPATPGTASTGDINLGDGSGTGVPAEAQALFDAAAQAYTREKDTAKYNRTLAAISKKYGLSK